MSSRNKNFRRVCHADDDDDGDNENESPTTTTTTPATATIKTTNSTTTTTKLPRSLCFKDEEEEEEEESPFTSIRRSSSNKSDRKKSSISSSSHKLTLTKNCSSSLNVKPQAGEYTKEKLRELEKNTPSLARSRLPPPPSSDEPLFILKGSLKPHESSLQEEDERDGRGNSFENRLASISIGKIDKRKNVNLLMKEDEEDHEEDKIWEEEQFRKGIGKMIDNGAIAKMLSSSVPMTNHTLQQQQQQQTYAYPTNASIGSPMLGGVAGVSRSAEVMSISQQSDIACRSMQDNIRRLQESHARTILSMNRVEENLLGSLSNITSLEKSLEAGGEKFIFMQKLRDFVSVICDFLQDKAPFLEELEEQLQKLQEDRASATVKRRAADYADEIMEIDAGQAASSAAKGQSNLPAQLDEYGRDVNLQKQMDMMRRAEARKHRKAKAYLRRPPSVGDDNSKLHVEGESSTDESDSESTSYRSNRHELLQTAVQIFSHASDKYSQLSVVKESFERWKKIYSSSYRDAYMSLSAPAVFSPYVRLELLHWDPLYKESDFYDMQWHSLLFKYGLPENTSDLNPEDADANLVPGLVEKIALPILHHQIAQCWDMLSTRETRNAVSATNMVINYVPASSEALQDLLTVINDRLADAVGSLTVPNANAARLPAYRFGMSIRLLRNICLWKDIFALPVLEKLALDELLAGKILPHLRSVIANIHDAITRTERIVVALNGVWAGPGAIGEHSQRLQALVNYVLTLGKSLEKKHVSGVNESETSGLARRLKKMLVELNQYDMARALARTFQLKEAF
ncbi:hypothetical protein AQUCO_01000217v1 [Aquilegia coerulea]|uniref:GCF C-terminal domain-containing protein n=1 Tax=Aquilegia coerulea TaxID=218851 RepID=A0A2G5E8W1_AQUCA|nr:hypothetical protein AQUCO_01000217v1 [Aquilegia coerulea]